MAKVFRNSLYLFSAQSFIKVVAFLYALFLPNTLGIENYGLYSAALAYFSLMSSFADFGISRYLIREVSRSERNLPIIFSSVILLRLITVAILFIFFSAFIHFFDSNVDRAMLSTLAVLAVLPQSIALSLDGIFVAFQKISVSAIALIVLNLTSAVLGVSLVTLGYGVWGAILAVILGNIIYAIFLISSAIRLKINFLSQVKFSVFKDVVYGSLPYGLLGILSLLYFKVDTLLLSYIKGSYDTGIYAIAFKFIEAIVFVPSAVATSLFPVLAKLHSENIDEIKKYYYNSLKYLGLLSLIVLSGYLIVLPFVLEIFFPTFIPAIPAINILAFTIPFMFLHIPGAMVLLSSDKYLKQLLILSIFTLSFNVILNLILIPQYGFMGSSLVTVLSEAVTFVVFFVCLQYYVFNTKEKKANIPT